MQKYCLLALVCLGCNALPLCAGERPDPLVWVNAAELTVEGKGWRDTKAFYDRLPARAEKIVPEKVWDLSRDSAGIAVRFVSDSPALHVRWTITGKAPSANPHMAVTGGSGVDLYARDERDGGRWKWVECPTPRAKTTTALIADGLRPGEREYLLYLPLRNGVEALEIGIERRAKISAAPPRAEKNRKPLVFWGTSITHGAAASRPGMTHVAMLGRWFDRPVINLGFAGNGRMDPEVVPFVAELDPAVFIIDCLPNMNPESIAERAGPLVAALRKARPETPILLVEDRNYAGSWVVEARAGLNARNQQALKAEYEKLKAAGVKHIYYLEGKDLIGDDHEGTVDSSHPNDLGFHRQAQAFEKVLKEILK